MRGMGLSRGQMEGWERGVFLGLAPGMGTTIIRGLRERLFRGIRLDIETGFISPVDNQTRLNSSFSC
jgi:hypothetical protein